MFIFVTEWIPAVNLLCSAHRTVCTFKGQKAVLIPVCLAEPSSQAGMTRQLTVTTAKKRWMENVQYSRGITALCHEQRKTVDPGQLKDGLSSQEAAKCLQCSILSQTAQLCSSVT